MTDNASERPPSDEAVSSWASDIDPKFGSIVGYLLGVDEEDDRA